MRHWILTVAVLWPTIGVAQGMPDFVGQNIQSITSAKAATSMQIQIESVPSRLAAGTVVFHTPSAGGQIGADGVVIFGVSAGLKAPVLVGQTADAAKELLAELGVTVEELRVEEKGYPGEVLRQSPAPGVNFDASREVIFLTVSVGGDVMPELSGGLLDYGLERLNRLGFTDAREEPRNAEAVSKSSLTQGFGCGPNYITGWYVDRTEPPAGTFVQTNAPILVHHSYVNELIEVTACSSDGSRLK